MTVCSATTKQTAHSATMATIASMALACFVSKQLQAAIHVMKMAQNATSVPMGTTCRVEVAISAMIQFRAVLSVIMMLAL